MPQTYQSCGFRWTGLINYNSAFLGLASWKNRGHSPNMQFLLQSWHLFLQNLFTLSFTETKALVLTWQKLDQLLKPILHTRVSQFQRLSPFCSHIFPSLEGFSSASHSYFLHPQPRKQPQQLAEAMSRLALPFTSELSLPPGKDLPLVFSAICFFRNQTFTQLICISQQFCIFLTWFTCF